METRATHKCHGGTLGFYTHSSRETSCDMNFSLFLPPKHDDTTPTPYIIFLSGLTCTEENFSTKAHAYQFAAEHGIAILAPDTSPRGDNIPNDDAYDLGQGAGLYLDATQAPWNTHFRMESYLIKELTPTVEKYFALNNAHKSIMGHSMGGHGAISLYLKHPTLFSSCSAFAPIVAPSHVPWGQKAFTTYLGEDKATWRNHDSSELIRNAPAIIREKEIFIDQGLADQFLEEQLKTSLFAEACAEVNQPIIFREHEGYDHSYYFIQSFIEDHITWHAQFLR